MNGTNVSYRYAFLMLATAACTLMVAPSTASANTPAPTPKAVNTGAPTGAEATADYPALIGELITVTTKYEDTLVHLARKYNVGFVEIRAANPGVDPWLPGSGTRVVIPAQYILPDGPRKGVVINLSEMRLYHYQTPGEPPVSYPIGIGRSGLTTPLGTATVARKMVDPTWYPTERMRREDPTLPAVVPPGPENPMGTHAMYLSWESYAIHGTDKPYSIGRRLSSGCIRMYPEDILTLFDRVAPGTPITVVDQPVKTAWVGNSLYLEVHPTQEQSDILSHDNAKLPEYQMSEKDLRAILKGAGTFAENLDWAKIRKAMKARNGTPLIIATKGYVPRDAAKEKPEDLMKKVGAKTPKAEKVTTAAEPAHKAASSAASANTRYPN